MRLSAPHCRRVNASLALPIKNIKIGISGAVNNSTSPDSQSSGNTTTRMVSGTSAASTICGRYWPK